MRYKLSFIVVFHNEELYLERCIRSLIGAFNNLPDVELIFVDSMSTDRSKDIVFELMKSIQYKDWHFYQNEKILLSSGWNIGIENAQGEYVCRIDAHAELDSDYLKLGLQFLEANPDYDGIGGILRTVSLSDDVLAAIMTSKLTVGNGFRNTLTSGDVSSPVYAIYRRKTFADVGLFDENLNRNQDNDFHHRCKVSGKRFYLDTSMVCRYYSRTTRNKIFKQMYENSYNLAIVWMKNGKNSLSAKYLAPLTFILLVYFPLIFSLWLNQVVFTILMCVLVVYYGAIFYTAFTMSNRLKDFFKIIATIPMIHLTYGLGLFLGFVHVGTCYFKKIRSFGWNAPSWYITFRRCVKKLDKNCTLRNGRNIDVLEIGSGLYSNCSDLFIQQSRSITLSNIDKNIVRKLQDRYVFDDRIKCSEMSIFDIHGTYDVIFAKSVIGGLFREVPGTYNEVELIDNLILHLKPGGALVIMDNAPGLLHGMTKRFGARANKWKFYEKNYAPSSTFVEFGFLSEFSWSTRFPLIGQLLEWLIVFPVDLVVRRFVRRGTIRCVIIER